MTAPTFSPYGGFSEGDHVTRDGTDVHLVKDITADGFAATFVCVVAPASGWSKVGEVEFNICQRYSRVIKNATTGEWNHAPNDLKQQHPDPSNLLQPMINRLLREILKLADVMAQGIIGGAGFARAWSQRTRPQRSRAYYRRTPKRRALRKR